MRVVHVEHDELREMLNVDPVGRAGDRLGKLRASERRELFADVEDLKAANRIRLL